jgi:hypothetical protein
MTSGMLASASCVKKMNNPKPYKKISVHQFLLHYKDIVEIVDGLREPVGVTSRGKLLFVVISKKELLPDRLPE